MSIKDSLLNSKSSTGNFVSESRRRIQWEPEETPAIVTPAMTINRPFLYYYPNRPILMPPDPKNPLKPGRWFIDSLEAQKRYVAEMKWNGDNTLIYTDSWPPKIWTRHKTLIARYTPTPEVLEELSKWPRNSIINAELMNNHTKGTKNTFIVHCIMAWKGQLLLGKRWGDSRKLIEQMQSGTYVKISQIWTQGFWDLFDSAVQSGNDDIEGIILKDPTGRLVFSSSPIKDCSWMIKIRKPCAKYRY